MPEEIYGSDSAGPSALVLGGVAFFRSNDEATTSGQRDWVLCVCVCVSFRLLPVSGATLRCHCGGGAAHNDFLVWTGRSVSLPSHIIPIIQNPPERQKRAKPNGNGDLMKMVMT